MPCVENIRPKESDDPQSVSAVELELYLPHSLTAEARSQLPQGLLTKYRRLRFAQAEDALGALKRSLRKGATLFDHQSKQTAGTGFAANTRIRSAIHRQDARARLDAARYRAARDVLLVLDPRKIWQKRLKELLDTDCRPPAARAEENSGRGKAKVAEP